MRKVRVDRKKWQRNWSPKNRLWDNNTCQGCILGHAIHQIDKCSWKELDGLSTPKDYYQRESVFTGCYDYEYMDLHTEVENNGFAELAMEINDDYNLNDHQREEALIKLFKEEGMILEFYN